MHARAHIRERALSGWGHAYSRFHTSLATRECVFLVQILASHEASVTLPRPFGFSRERTYTTRPRRTRTRNYGDQMFGPHPAH